MNTYTIANSNQGMVNVEHDSNIGLQNEAFNFN